MASGCHIGQGKASRLSYIFGYQIFEIQIQGMWSDNGAINVKFTW